jgi:hypothetical protein
VVVTSANSYGSGHELVESQSRDGARCRAVGAR